MAFTTRSDKTGLQGAPCSTPDELGPGYYSLKSDVEKAAAKGQAFAPFTSLSDKLADGPGVEAAPPPGTYDTSYSWGGAKPGLTSGGLPCKFVPFKSTGDRFGVGSVLATGSGKDQPGPGEYKLKGVSDLGPAQMAKTIGRPPEDPPELRAMSAPSIPVGHQCWGYSEGPRGLIRHSGPRIYAGVGADSIGPDVYQPSVRSTKPARDGATFGRAARSGPAGRTADGPGPGNYKIKGFANRGPDRRSASFMSTTERKGAGSSGGCGAAPGSYNPRNGAIKVQGVRRDNQFFNSTAERFPSGGRRNDEARTAPGPGQYKQMPGDVRITQFGKSAGNRFGGHGDFTEPWRSCCDPTAPGPGSYELEPVYEDEFTGESAKGAKPLHSFSVLAHQGSSAFGSTTKRFAHKQAFEAPGPATYGEMNRGSRANDDAYARKVRDSTPSNFNSKSIKLKIAGNFHDQKPEPATYDPKLPAANVPRNRKPTEGFLGSERRFYSRAADDMPGPGQYVSTYQSIGDKPTVNRALGAGGSLGFNVTEQRTDLQVKSAMHEDTPGPGTYLVAKDLNNKSHNQIFQMNATS